MRRQLLAWFRTKATALADAYEGAINLLADSGFPGRIHFIAHAGRDIADRLVFVLDPQLEGSRVQYENALDRIEKVWPDIQGISGNGSRVAADGSVDIDYKLALDIDKLVQAHRERRRRPSHYELLFQYLMRHEPFKATLNRRLVNDFKKMRQWFMALTHLRAGGVPQVDEDDLQQQFYRFEAMLHSFVGDFFTGSSELDDILRQANQRTD
jgi:hypothetical protein